MKHHSDGERISLFTCAKFPLFLIDLPYWSTCLCDGGALHLCGIKSFLTFSFCLIILASSSALSWYLSIMFCHKVGGLSVCVSMCPSRRQAFWRQIRSQILKNVILPSLSLELTCIRCVQEGHRTDMPVLSVVMILNLKTSPINQETSSELMDLVLKRISLFLTSVPKALSIFESFFIV